MPGRSLYLQKTPRGHRASLWENLLLVPDCRCINELLVGCMWDGFGLNAKNLDKYK